MSQPEQFDALIIGTGQGGKYLAWHLGQQGRRVAAVERRWIGGSCPNIACLPSKNEVWSAEVAHLARNGAQYGAMTGPVSVDMAKVVERKREMVAREVEAHLRNFSAAGVDLVMGEARFTAPKTVEVALNEGGTRTLTAEQVFINVGTHAAIPAVPGLEAARPLTHIEALEVDYLPSHLVVLGGGYVGLELAQAFRRFGSRVTIIEFGPRLLSREDPDVSEEVRRILEKEGVRVLIAGETLRVEGRSGEAVQLTVRTPAGEETIEASDILVAAGRIPNTEGIELEEAGVERKVGGYIRVNGRLETTAPGVWALGECAGSPQFTHISVDDYRIIRDNLAGGQRSTEGRLVPYCMFIDPPLARVGLNESEAERLGIAVRRATLPIATVLRTEATGEKEGFMKALVSTSDDRILGFIMIGADAGEVMPIVQTAMLGNLPYNLLRDAPIAHPTMAEGLGPLFEAVPPLD